LTCSLHVRSFLSDNISIFQSLSFRQDRSFLYLSYDATLFDRFEDDSWQRFYMETSWGEFLNYVESHVGIKNGKSYYSCMPL
jgi:hypothetical protein